MFWIRLVIRRINFALKVFRQFRLTQNRFRPGMFTIFVVLFGEGSVFKVFPVRQVAIVVIFYMAFKNRTNLLASVFTAEFLVRFFQGFPAVAVFPVIVGIIIRRSTRAEEMIETFSVKQPVDPFVNIFRPNPGDFKCAICVL